MYISSDELARLHTERCGYNYENGNLKREIEALVVATLDNAMRTNGEERYRTIYHMVSQCITLLQKEYTTIHDWEKRVIH